MRAAASVSLLLAMAISPRERILEFVGRSGMPRIRPVHSCFQRIFSRRWSPETNVRTFEPRIPECLSAALANTPIFETLETKERNRCMEAAVDRGETAGGRFYSGIFVGGGWFDRECLLAAGREMLSFGLRPSHAFNTGLQPVAISRVYPWEFHRRDAVPRQRISMVWPQSFKWSDEKKTSILFVTDAQVSLNEVVL